MIISSINEVKIYHSLTYCTKLVNLCLSMLSLPTIEMYAKPSLPGELVYINAKIGKVLRTSYQLSIKQGLGSASGYLIEKGGRRISSCVRKMPLTLAAKILCIHTGRTCARCPAVALCPSNRDVNKISQTFSQYSNIQVFQLQVDSQCLINGESISSSFQQVESALQHLHTLIILDIWTNVLHIHLHMNLGHLSIHTSTDGWF